MPNNFDSYREALVIETATHWPGAFQRLSPADRARVAERLHAEPRQAASLAYIRMHTGFCREITVTEDDLRRLGHLPAVE